MPAPCNEFKKRLLAGEKLIGCWLGLTDGYAAHMMGTVGFDWLLIDGEHAPNDIRSIRDQVIALEGSQSAPVVRLPIGETWLIKQVLDLGVQTILVPMVESADQARELVQAMRYPPAGRRGVGAALARASGYSGFDDYVATADDQMCLLVQVETRAGLNALEEIAQVEGVDGVFIGPADLSADFGASPSDPDMHARVLDALRAVEATGKAPGIISTEDKVIADYFGAGARFVAVGIDLLMMLKTARSALNKWTD